MQSDKLKKASCHHLALGQSAQQWSQLLFRSRGDDSSSVQTSLQCTDSNERLTDAASSDIQHLDSATAQPILKALPEHVRQAYLLHAAEIEYPVEAVLEMVIAGFLDSEAFSFVDCKPSVEMLEEQISKSKPNFR